MRPRGVVVSDPGADEPTGLIEIDEQSLIEKLVAHPAVEGLDAAVLHRSARCDVMPIHTMILRPAQHRVRGELGAIVGNDHLRLAARADEHRQLACNSFARDRGVGNCRQTYARHIIDNVEDAEAPALGELVMDEVERPARVDLGLDQDRRARSDPLSAEPCACGRSALLRDRADRCG